MGCCIGTDTKWWKDTWNEVSSTIPYYLLIFLFGFLNNLYQEYPEGGGAESAFSCRNLNLAILCVLFFSQHGPEAMMAIAFTCRPSVIVVNNCGSFWSYNSYKSEILWACLGWYSTLAQYVSETAGFWGDFEVEKLAIFIHFERTLWKFLKLL